MKYIERLPKCPSSFPLAFFYHDRQKDREKRRKEKRRGEVGQDRLVVCIHKKASGVYCVEDRWVKAKQGWGRGKERRERYGWDVFTNFKQI